MQIKLIIRYLLVTMMVVMVVYSDNSSADDVVVPIITLNGDNPQIIEKGATYTELGASLSVNDGSTIYIDKHVNTSVIGDYYVKYYGIGAFTYILPVIRRVKVIDSSN